MTDLWEPKYGFSARGRRRAERLVTRVAPLLPTGERLELVAECFVDSGFLEAALGLPGWLSVINALMFFKQRTIWLGDTHLGLLSRGFKQELLVARDSIVVMEFSYLAPAALIVQTPAGRHRFSFGGPWLQHAKELSDRLPHTPDQG